MSILAMKATNDKTTPILAELKGILRVRVGRICCKKTLCAAKCKHSENKADDIKKRSENDEANAGAYNACDTERPAFLFVHLRHLSKNEHMYFMGLNIVAYCTRGRINPLRFARLFLGLVK